VPCRVLVTTQTQVGFQLGSNPNSDVAPASPLPAHADPLGQVIVVDAPGEHQQPAAINSLPRRSLLANHHRQCARRIRCGYRRGPGRPRGDDRLSAAGRSAIGQRTANFTEAIDNVAGILTGAGWSIVEVKQSAVIGIDQAAVAAAFQLIVVARKQAG